MVGDRTVVVVGGAVVAARGLVVIVDGVVVDVAVVDVVVVDVVVVAAAGLVAFVDGGVGVGSAVVPDTGSVLGATGSAMLGVVLSGVVLSGVEPSGVVLSGTVVVVGGGVMVGATIGVGSGMNTMAPGTTSGCSAA